jgi:hypothetical protein
LDRIISDSTGKGFEYSCQIIKDKKSKHPVCSVHLAFRRLESPKNLSTTQDALDRPPDSTQKTQESQVLQWTSVADGSDVFDQIADIYEVSGLLLNKVELFVKIASKIAEVNPFRVSRKKSEG